jgi:arginine:agmatine antiporter
MNDRPGGKGGIGPVAATFFVAGSMIGSGIYLLPASLGAIGSIALLGWLLAAVGAVLMAAVMARLAVRAPGGFVGAIEQAFGRRAALAAAITYLLLVVLANVGIVLAVAGYLSVLLNLPGEAARNLLALAVLFLLILLNLAGSARVAQWASATFLLGLLPILLVATLGWRDFDTDLFRAGWNVSGLEPADAVLRATLLVFWAFLGLEAASAISGQLRDPVRHVGVATIGGVAIAALVYVLASAAIMGLVPAARLAASAGPFADAAAVLLGGSVALAVAAAAAAKASGTAGGFLLIGAETFDKVGASLWPRPIARSRVLIGLGGVQGAILLATAAPSLGNQFATLVGAVVALALPLYAACGLALLRLAPAAPLSWVAGGGAMLFALLVLLGQPLPLLSMAALVFLGITLVAGLARIPR